VNSFSVECDFAVIGHRALILSLPPPVDEIRGLSSSTIGVFQSSYETFVVRGDGHGCFHRVSCWHPMGCFHCDAIAMVIYLSTRFISIKFGVHPVMLCAIARHLQFAGSIQDTRTYQQEKQG